MSNTGKKCILNFVGPAHALTAYIEALIEAAMAQELERRMTRV